MDTCVIACETIKEELRQAVSQTGCTYDIFWLEAGLHNYPDKLKDVLQKTICRAEGYKRILLAMGYCGNSISGIYSGISTLIIPRVDDCISLLLGSVKHRMDLTKGCGTYFFTKGWLSGEKNLWMEYQYAVEKYGEKRAKRVMKMMLGHYERLGVVDTGAYPVEEILPETKKIAETLELRHEVMRTDGGYLQRLLTGPWNEEQFLIIEPGKKVEPEQLLKYF